MTIRSAPTARPTTRILLLALTLLGAFPGIWAVLAPESFYTDFPGARVGWVSADGPYNEHLIRDVGAMFLALGVVALLAAVSGSLAAARLAGAGWVVFTAIHCVYHLGHLDLYERLDQVLNLVSLIGSVLLAAVVILLPGRQADSPAVNRAPDVTEIGRA